MDIVWNTDRVEAEELYLIIIWLSWQISFFKVSVSYFLMLPHEPA